MDQEVSRSLLAEFDAIAMTERQDELNAVMKQKSPSYSHAALLLIKEMLFALEIHHQEEHYLERAGLIDALIKNDEIPEEYAHQLLRLKLAYYLKKKDYDYILCALSRIEDPQDRLACSTYDCYKLMLMKTHVLLAQHRYQQAYNYVQGISDTHFDQDYFLELPSNEKNDIINEYLLKKALAAHFCALPESYDLFQALLQKPNNGFQLNSSNFNFYITFGNECLERNKLPEAKKIFSNLFDFLNTIENKTQTDLNSYEKVRGMLKLINAATTQCTPLSPVIDTSRNDRSQQYSPLYHADSTQIKINKLPNLDVAPGVKSETVPLVGKNSLSV